MRDDEEKVPEGRIRDKEVAGGRIGVTEDAQPSLSFFRYLRKNWNREDYINYVEQVLQQNQGHEGIPDTVLRAIAGIDPDKKGLRAIAGIDPDINLWTTPPHLKDVPLGEKAKRRFSSTKDIDYYTSPEEDYDPEVAQLTAQLEAWEAQEIAQNIGANASAASVFEYQNRNFQYDEDISPDQPPPQQQQQPLIPEAFTNQSVGKRVLSDNTLAQSEAARTSKGPRV